MSEVFVVDDRSKHTPADVTAATLSGCTSDRILTYSPDCVKASGVRRGILEPQGTYVLLDVETLDTPQTLEFSGGEFSVRWQDSSGEKRRIA